MGTSWANFQALQTTFKMKCDNKTELGTCFPTFRGLGEPKSSQHDSDNNSRFETIFKSETVALQEPLGTLLDMHFGGHLGVPKSAPVLKNVTFGEHSHF